MQTVTTVGASSTFSTEVIGDTYYYPITSLTTPSTGTTDTAIPLGTGHVFRVINPSGTLAALTEPLPSAALRDGQEVDFICNKAVTALSFSGGTVLNAPTTCTAGQHIPLVYSASNSSWQ